MNATLFINPMTRLIKMIKYTYILTCMNTYRLVQYMYDMILQGHNMLVLAPETDKLPIVLVG